jgi:hypothetical protein
LQDYRHLTISHVWPHIDLVFNQANTQIVQRQSGCEVDLLARSRCISLLTLHKAKLPEHEQPELGFS